MEYSPFDERIGDQACPDTMSKVNVALIRSRLNEKGYGNNMKGASKAAGLGETALRDLITPGRKGNLNPTMKTLKSVGNLLDLSPTEIMSGVAPPFRVPVIGRVSAGDGWSSVDDDEREEVELSVEDGAFAILVRGESMLPVYRPGDLLIAIRRPGSKIEAMLGLDCIVETVGGERYVKRLAPGSKGRFTLRSYNRGDIEDVALAWAAPITWVRRRR
jgi:SOS-response transcriptional repressor LexA